VREEKPEVTEILATFTVAAAPANARVVVTPFVVFTTDTFVSRFPIPFAEYNKVNVHVCKLPRVAPLHVSDVIEKSAVSVNWILDMVWDVLA
jgi:hypothetical protein